MPRSKLAFWAVSALAFLGPTAAAEENWGRFSGEIVAKFLSDGRNMRIERPFGYTDPRGQRWDVPAGSTTDGASVPQFFWAIFPPFTGKYRAAAVVHDHYCQSKARSWRDTHEAFYSAMRASGVGETAAKAMYGAVYNFGPRWGIGTGNRGPGVDKFPTAAEQEAYFRGLEAWIAEERPSPKEIATRLDAGGDFRKGKR